MNYNYVHLQLNSQVKSNKLSDCRAFNYLFPTVVFKCVRGAVFILISVVVRCEKGHTQQSKQKRAWRIWTWWLGIWRWWSWRTRRYEVQFQKYVIIIDQYNNVMVKNIFEVSIIIIRGYMFAYLSIKLHQ